MRDITCRRLANQTVACSILHRHKHHSPTGFEIGYGGSGPADLALNILAAALPLEADEQGVKLWDGSYVSEAAWGLHQPFKWELIATIPREGGTIAGVVVEAWIAAHRRDVE